VLSRLCRALTQHPPSSRGLCLRSAPGCKRRHAPRPHLPPPHQPPPHLPPSHLPPPHLPPSHLPPCCPVALTVREDLTSTKLQVSITIVSTKPRCNPCKQAGKGPKPQTCSQLAVRRCCCCSGCCCRARSYRTSIHGCGALRVPATAHTIPLSFVCPPAAQHRAVHHLTPSPCRLCPPAAQHRAVHHLTPSHTIPRSFVCPPAAQHRAVHHGHVDQKVPEGAAAGGLGRQGRRGGEAPPVEGLRGGWVKAQGQDQSGAGQGQDQSRAELISEGRVGGSAGPGAGQGQNQIRAGPGSEQGRARIKSGQGQNQTRVGPESNQGRARIKSGQGQIKSG